MDFVSVLYSELVQVDLSKHFHNTVQFPGKFRVHLLDFKFIYASF